MYGNKAKCSIKLAMTMTMRNTNHQLIVFLYKMEAGRRGHGRAIRRVVDEELREEIRILNARLATVEARRRRDP